MMLLTQAIMKEGKEGGIELVEPPPGSKPGDRVYFEGPEYESKGRHLETAVTSRSPIYRCCSSLTAQSKEANI
jgi:hypothetical protein